MDPNKIDLNKTIQDIDIATPRGWGLAITNKLSQKMEISNNIPSGTKIALEFAT